LGFRSSQVGRKKNKDNNIKERSEFHKSMPKHTRKELDKISKKGSLCVLFIALNTKNYLLITLQR
jgi:hypothetical protein